MSEHRLPDYLDHIQQAATDACGFVEGLAKEDFFEDKRTQRAVKELGLSLVEDPPNIFRFVRELGGGDWQGNVVPRTAFVRTGKNSQC